MEEELATFSRDIKALELQLEQKELQLNAKDKEIKTERLKMNDLKTELRSIKAGLHNSARFIQEPKELKEAVKELYRRHLGDFEQVRDHLVHCRQRTCSTKAD